MKQSLKPFLFISIFICLYNCAKTGRPEGGPKDENAPLLVTADPPYESINFKKNRIKIYFDEFIRLKDVNKQLVISPPLKNPPIITPQGTASKFIDIKILDTLLPNSTYIFNFGNAIEDNNESNKLESFKYVFSTGNHIDSLTASGKVKDAFSKKTEKNINLLLYKIDSSFNDSIIYKQKPNYVSNTLDSTIFNFSNLKKGNYLLIALKQSTNNYIYNPKTDKMGFSKNIISLPKDSIITNDITIFKETSSYQFKKGKEVSKGKIQFSFIGNAKDLSVTPLYKTPKNFKSVSKFETEKDTLNYWHTSIEQDSLNFLVKNKKIIDTVTVFLRKKKLDSLTITATHKRTLHLRDTFYLESNTPITFIDTKNISLYDKDTIPVKFSTIVSKKENKIAILFDKKPSQSYQLNILPKSFLDIYSVTNDTLKYLFKTKEFEDYGKITLDVKNPKSKNVIIELIDNKKNLIDRKFTSKNTSLIFNLLVPKKYTFRAIIDNNKNNQWDTGNFLQKIQPEKVIYLNKEIEVRPNYYYQENFTVN